MARAYRGRPPKIRKTVKGGNVNPDSFFGLFSSLKNIFSFGNKDNTSQRVESVGGVQNIVPAAAGGLNVASLYLPTYETGGIVEIVKNYNTIVNEYISDRSFVPSTYPQEWKDAKKLKYQPFQQLSPEKLASVFAYTEDKTKVYEKVNELLRFGDYSGEDSENIKFFADNLQGAFKELVDSESKPVELHRVISGDYADTISQLKPGDTFEEKGFGSWSEGEYKNPRGDQFIKPGETNVVLRTESNKGYNVSPISRFPREEEYIIPPVQKYSVEDNTPGAIYSRKGGEVAKINLKQFFSGGKVNTRSGKDITGAGVDTQLIAAQPGEVVINKATVDKIGPDFFLGLNKKFGGANANKPKKAKVQSASGGGLINFISAFASGGEVNYDRIRQEITQEGTIDGEKLTPEQRKKAFKLRSDKKSFNKFVNAFLGKEEPKTQTGVGQTPPPPPAVPGQNLLPAAPGTSALAVKPPVPESANRQSTAESAEKRDADSEKERKKRKSGATLEQNVAAIRKTVDSIFETLVKQNDFIRNQFGLARKLDEDKKRKAKEERFEGGKGDKKAKKAVDKVVKPFSNILDKIINFFSSIFLGKALIGLVSWFGDPDNQSKVESIGRFLKDWWPALLGAYLIFGNGLTKFVIGITSKLLFFAGRMLITVIPALGRAIARNPKAAAAAALFGAGALVPAMFPDTVKDAADKQASDAEKEVGKEQAAAQIEAQNKDRNIFQQVSDFFTGAGAEREEQAARLRTGEEKRYGLFGEIPAKRKGGEVTTSSGTDIKGAGVDTQLIAARPGEVVINKATVDSVGADFFLALNKKFGGPQANKPKMAKGVQAAQFGGMVVPAFSTGGEVGQSVPTGGTYMAERGERIRDDLVKWAMANPALAGTLKAGDTGYREAKAAALNYGNAIFNNGFTGLEPGLGLGQQTIESLGTRAQNMLPQAQQAVESLGPSLQEGAMSIVSQGEGFLTDVVDTGDSIARDVQQRYESGELENDIASSLQSAQTTGAGLLNTGRSLATNSVGNTFDGLINVASSDAYKGLAQKNAAVDEKEISIADSIVNSLPEGSPLQDIADKGLIPIPSGDASTMRNLTFVKALLGPLGKPFKILSNDEVDRMRQQTIDMTLNKSGLIVDSDGEVRMNWNQEDINKGAKGGGAYTDDLGPGGKAFNSILGRFTASTRGGGNTLYTDDRYNFNLSTAEYLTKAKEQLLGGAFGEAGYFAAASLGKFAEDMGWLNQRALGSRIAVGQVDRSKVEGASQPKVADMTPDQIRNAQEYAASKGKYFSSRDGKTYASYQDAVNASRGGAAASVTSQNISSASRLMDKGDYAGATKALGGDPSLPPPTPTITPTKTPPKRAWYDPRGWIGKQGGGIVGMQGGGFNLLNPMSWFSGKAQKATKGELAPVDPNTIAGKLYNRRLKQEEMLRQMRGYQGGGFNLLNPMSWFSGQAQKATKGEMAPVKDNTIAGKLYNRRLKQEEMLKKMRGYQGGMSITESTGMDLPGAGADRQLIRVQPGEYILPFDTVMRLGGPSAVDSIVAQTDSNSTAAKLGLNKPQSMAVEQPVMSDDSAMVSTLPPIVQATGGGGYGTVGKGPEVPSVSVSSNTARRRAKTMFGLVG